MKMLVALALTTALFAASAAWIEPLYAEDNFKTFLSSRNKKYNMTEYAFRLGVFQRNMRRAVALGEGFGINRFADSTPEELNRFRGFRHATTAQRRAAMIGPDAVHSVPTVSALPRSIDWRDSRVVTAVYDQGDCGSCWAFSAVEEIESRWAMLGQRLSTLSVQQVVDCDTSSYGCDGGDPPDAYKYVKKAGGIMLAQSYPYTSGRTGKEGKCKGVSGALVAVDKTVFAIPECTGKCDKQNETAMQEATVAYGPLSVCVDAADDWFLYTGGVYRGTCQTNERYINHCVQVVGYGTDGSVTWWIVRNSWSEDWGEAGYIRLRLGINQCSVATEVTYVTVHAV